MHNKEDLTMQDILRMAQSPTGQQLIRLLQQSGGQQLQQAMEKATTGDYTQAKETIASLMKDPEKQKLLEQLGR